MTNDELHEFIDEQATAALKTLYKTEYTEIKRVIFMSISTVLNVNGIGLTGKPDRRRKVEVDDDK